MGFGMLMNYLDFEQPIAELQEKIDELRRVGAGSDLNLTDEITRLETKRDGLIKSIFSKLTAQQVVQMARHPLRPYTQDYIDRIFTDFTELHGDRHFGAGAPIVGGLARLDGESVMLIGHQKGRGTQEKIKRNFGMARPEDFRKALRLMKLAEKFSIPVICFIDTPGAYPGIGAEERNQSEAIARNLFEMAELTVPIICVVLGEGCSGGALAIGVGDKILMLQYSYYSVISPEGCASILWKSSDKAGTAAEAMGLTAARLLELNLIDEIIPEPLGGAHSDVEKMSATIKERLLSHLSKLKKLSKEQLVERRYQYWLSKGQRVEG